jgi:hypothetical protein
VLAKQRMHKEVDREGSLMEIHLKLKIKNERLYLRVNDKDRLIF